MTPTVTVTGSASSPVVPDRAVLRVAAHCRAETVTAASAGAAQASSAIVETAARQVPAERIATTQVQLWPVTGPSGDPAGFESRHQLRIEVEDLDTAQLLLDGLVAEVGDGLAVESVSLEASDETPALTRARRLAFEDARRQAAELAACAEAGLGPILSIDTDRSSGPVAARAMSLQPGEQQVSTTVTVCWELQPQR